MAVNNETGVKTDVPAIASLAKQKGISFMVDGVAWLGKEPVDILDGVSAMCFSGYKFHAPKGVGFAYLRSSLKLSPLTLRWRARIWTLGGHGKSPGYWEKRQWSRL